MRTKFKFDKYYNIAQTLLSVLIITILLFQFLLLPVYIYNITENSDKLSKNYYYTVSGETSAYDQIYFISTNGDDSTGLSLSTGFNSIVSALDLASTDSQANTLIILSAGDHDVDLPGEPTYSCNVHIVGSDNRKSMLTNNHVDSISVLTLSGKAEISNMRIYGANECGIKFTGASGIINNVAFVALYSTNISILACYESAGIITIDNSEFVGDAGGLYTTLIKINQSGLFEIENTEFYFGIKGLDLYNCSYGAMHDLTFGEIGGSAYTADSDCHDLYMEAIHFRFNELNLVDPYNTKFIDQEH